MIDFLRCLEEALVQSLLARELRNHNEVRVTLTVASVFCLDAVQEIFYLELNLVELITVAMNCDLKVLLSEDVGGNLLHGLNRIIKDWAGLLLAHHVCGILAEEHVAAEGLVATSERFETRGGEAASIAHATRSNSVLLVDCLHLDQVRDIAWLVEVRRGKNL